MDRKNQYIFDNDDTNEPNDTNIINQNNINNNEINQDIKTNENNNSNQYTQQAALDLGSENKGIENEDNLEANNENEKVDLNQLTINKNDHSQRDLNNNYNQNIQENENISSGEQLRENISQNEEKEVKDDSLQPMDRVSKKKRNNENNHVEKLGDSNLNNVNNKIEGNVDLNNIKIDMNNLNLENKDLPEVFGSSDINKFQKSETTITTNKIGNIDTNGLPPTFFIKEDTNINTGNNLNKFNIENKGISIGNYQLPSNDTFKDENIITASVTKVDPKNYKQIKLEQNSYLNPINYQQSAQQVSGPININLNQFGIQHNSSPISINGNKDYNKYFQQSSQTNPQSINLNQYFQNTNYQQQLDLNNIGINVNSTSGANNGLDLQALGLNVGQGISTNSNFTQVDNMNSLGGIDLNAIGYHNSQQISQTNNKVNFAFPNPTITVSSNYAIPNSLVSNSSSYNNYAGPTQSYSYNYSYNMPSVG